MKATGLRFHLEKEEKKIGITKLGLVANVTQREGFLPKI